MSLDVSDAIALAKDLLKTSDDFHTHDPEMATEFANRAYEICDDLGIDRDLISDPHFVLVDQSVASMSQSLPKTPDDEAKQTSEQLNNLLQEQARVLQNVHEEEKKPEPEPEPKKRRFRLFGRRLGGDFGALQSA